MGFAPHEFVEDARTGRTFEQARRQQQIVDLVGFRSAAEGSGPVFIGVAAADRLRSLRAMPSRRSTANRTRR
jgi:hypothetical protein